VTEIYNALLDATTHEWTEARHTLEERTDWLAEKRAGAWPVFVAFDVDEVVGRATYGDFPDSGRWPGYRFTVEQEVSRLPGIGHTWGQRLDLVLMQHDLDRPLG
jgi:L-amino acid N-acyltransferase YncA